jgi:hypothetical protein
MSQNTTFKVGDWIVSLNEPGEPSPEYIIHLHSFDGSAFKSLIFQHLSSNPALLTPINDKLISISYFEANWEQILTHYSISGFFGPFNPFHHPSKDKTV